MTNPHDTHALESFVRLERVGKTYEGAGEPVHALSELSVCLPEGSFTALMGPSGSGKTTLLNLIAGLDRVTQGEIEVAGSDMVKLPDSRRARWRSENVGFIFQSFHLIPVLSAVENVELPLNLTPIRKREKRERALTALRVVGLSDRAHHRPSQLSGGQEQRVAIARAIVTDPRIIIADEPTGDLDRQSADAVLDLLERLNQEFGKTIIMVTHDPIAADRARTTLSLNKGALIQ